jgi:peptidoglycan/LPS O-acetylase OafA/YrhL
MILHLTFLHGLLPREAVRIFGPAWTLSLEAQFYLVAPLVMPALRKRPWVTMGVAFGINLIGLSLFGGRAQPGAWLTFQYPSVLPCRIFLFLVGSWACVFLFEKTRAHATLLGASAGAMFFLFGYKSASVVALALGLACAMAHPAMPLRPWLERLMKSAPIRFLANISYGIYLFHMFLIAMAFVAIRRLYPGSPPPAAGVALYFALVLVSMCIVSAIAFYFLEEPSRLMGRRISKRFVYREPEGSG